MNTVGSQSGHEHLRSLQILDELSQNDSLTQRDLSTRLGMALGLVNSYIKNLIAKGYITVKAIPPKRYAYYLTPRGFAEKTRLTYNLLHDYTRIYREARQNLKKLFKEMQTEGMKKVLFAGVDEVAEIAFISLQETDIEVTDVVDIDMADKMFFKKTVLPIDRIKDLTYDCIVITSYLKREKIYRELLINGATKKEIRAIFALDDLHKP